MCRLFCSPARDIAFNKKDLWEYFYRLEKALGKDGNGIYNFTTKELLKFHDKMPIEANINGGILFHTRYATNGYVRDYNCQPFDSEKYVLAHNGIFSSIEVQARLLGFPYSEKKYSDTYMMAWVMEKTGILNFYNAFRGKHYGVIIVYDKKTDKIYLLKTGGSFEYGIFDDGIHIYGSTALDFWGLKEKAKSMDNGLFIIHEKGFTQLDKLKTYTTVYYGNRDNGYGYEDMYDYGYGHNIVKFKNKIKKKKIQQSIDKIVKDSIPTGIASLFPSLIPKECHGCNWVYKRKCWFGGIDHNFPLSVKHPDTDEILCNTIRSSVDILIKCSKCEKSLNQNSDWGIVDEEILCHDCEILEDYYDKECKDCEYHKIPSTEEPCISCYNDDAIPAKWTEKIPDREICVGCYYERSSLKDYPCKVCEEKRDGMSEWTVRQGSHEKVEVCERCGWNFQGWDMPVVDEKGRLVCYECIYEDKEAEEIDEDDYWTESYDYYKNGKWRYG